MDFKMNNICALTQELCGIMARYDEKLPPDDSNGMAAPIMLGPEYFRKIVNAMLQSYGEVRQLEWDSFGLEMWSESVVGKYFISGHGGKWSWSFDDNDPYHHGEIVASEEAAKSAAQEHCEGLIMSAFIPTAHPADTEH